MVRIHVVALVALIHQGVLQTRDMQITTPILFCSTSSRCNKKNPYLCWVVYMDLLWLLEGWMVWPMTLRLVIVCFWTVYMYVFWRSLQIQFHHILPDKCSSFVCNIYSALCITSKQKEWCESWKSNKIDEKNKSCWLDILVLHRNIQQWASRCTT